MLKISIPSLLVTFSLLFTACSNDSSQDANNILSTNEYVLTSLNNTQYVIQKENSGFVLKNAKDKVIILDIFATWCPPCKAEATHLTSLQEKYKDKLLIIGITVEDTISNVELEKFRTDHDANYILVNSSENSRIIDAVAKELKIGRNFGIPLMAMYKDSKLINFYQGATEEEFIESDIKKALGL